VHARRTAARAGGHRGYMLRPMGGARPNGQHRGMDRAIGQRSGAAPAHAARTRLRPATERRTGRRASTDADAALDLLERQRLGAGELRILLALADREATISEVARSLRRSPREVRLAAARLYARGLLSWMFRRAQDGAGETEEVLGITGTGLVTIRSLLTS
jgi:hypothetical protein